MQSFNLVTQEQSQFVPTNCPECNNPLIWSSSQFVDLLCANQNCKGQIYSRLEHFCKCMKMEEFSIVTLRKLGVLSIVDLYSLDEESIVRVQGFGESKARIILSQISNSLIDVDPIDLLQAFGIQHLGRTNSSKVYSNLNGSNAFEKFDSFFSISKDELQVFCGKALCNSILESRESSRSMYEFLKNKLTFVSRNSSKYEGLQVALTGNDPKGRTRSQLELILKAHGMIPSNVNKKTNFLIAQDPNGSSSKCKKAREYCIEIVSYDFFDTLMS